ncbi:MAG: hypothetical protein E6G39_14640 [Actinobacteria bacterium]|nr:MAG: hypothetical protein E6G39_14640 [Actinomycetota bacterium]
MGAVLDGAPIEQSGKGVRRGLQVGLLHDAQHADARPHELGDGLEASDRPHVCARRTAGHSCGDGTGQAGRIPSLLFPVATLR